MHTHLKLNKLLFDLAILMKVRGVGLGLAFLTAISLARFLGPEEYGRYAFAMAIFMILEPIAGGGLSTLTKRELADPNTSSEVKQRQLTEFLTVAAALSLIAGALLATVLGTIGAIDPALALLAWVVIPGSILFQVSCSALAGQHLVKRSQFLSRVGKPALFLALLFGVFYASHNAIASSTTLWLMGLSSWLMLLAALHYSPIRPRLAFFEWPQWKRLVELLKISLPFAAITALQYVQTRIDVIFVGWYMQDADVGYYQVATRAAVLATIPASLLAAMMSPRFSHCYKSGDRVQLRAIFWKSSKLAAAASMAAFVCLWVLAEPLISGLFGATYTPSLEPFRILLLAQVLFSAIALPAALLTMSDWQSGLVKALVISASLNVVGNAILIPEYGLAGAAASTSTVGVVTLLLIGLMLARSGLVHKDGKRHVET